MRFISVCNFQSMKSPVELNSLLLTIFCYITWFDETGHWRPCRRGLYVKLIQTDIVHPLKALLPPSHTWNRYVNRTDFNVTLLYYYYYFIIVSLFTFGFIKKHNKNNAVFRNFKKANQ